jgi:plastocyanin
MHLATRSVAALFAAALVLGACGGGDDDAAEDGSEAPAAGGVTVTAQDFAFDPTTIEVESGEEVEVTLQNEDDTEHSITVEEAEFEIEAEGGESATGALSAPESSVEFFCKYHPDQMRGEVAVSGSASGDSTSRGTSDY